ncbi:hypothetical protein PMAYCL1PPCAC_33286 [Pristionchus mayeri]|uniref:G protein-coupled receptor n=1 Tax=Pristionchus mayeri TaxID=1317129 RepID=A0AAN5IGJ3_9BILA|nr:hypothetical protein PMAYCL1PPCAC_33286 [Pristionchus mayeri]
MNDIISVVVSVLTFIVNIILVIIISRTRKSIAISQKQSNNAEKGLITTSVVSFAFYLLFEINYLLARYLKVFLSGHIQFLFLGLSSMTPFWCLMLFAHSIRREIFKSKKFEATVVSVSSK